QYMTRWTASLVPPALPATTLLDTTSLEADPVAVFDPPQLVPGGSAIHASCSYFNNTSAEIVFPNEMCGFWRYVLESSALARTRRTMGLIAIMVPGLAACGGGGGGPPSPDAPPPPPPPTPDAPTGPSPSAFRVSSLALRDPHVFVNFGGCKD